jgi:hypothetical protein
MAWKANFVLPELLCPNCGCPKMVRSTPYTGLLSGSHCTKTRYIDEDNGVQYIHGFNDSYITGCQYPDVLIPMMWLTYEHPDLKMEFETKIRPGYAVDYPPAPLSHWVSKSKQGIPNILQMLVHIYNHICN